MTRPQSTFSALPADGTLIMGLIPARKAAKARGPEIETVLLGRAGAAVQGFFPDVAARATAIAEKRRTPAQLVLMLEPYEQFLPMAWRSLAARREMPAFTELAHGFVTCSRGWADVVADLVEALHPAETLVLQAPVVALPPAASPLPDTALAMVQRLYRLGVTLPYRQMARLAAVHRRLPQPEPLAAFTSVQVAALQARYAADLARIATIPGLRIAEPPRQQAAA